MISYLLSGPAAEPVTLAEAKALLRLDSTDEDALVTTLITAARLHVESITGRALLSQGWRLSLDCLPPDGVVTLPVGPLLSLDAITVFDDAGEPTSLGTAGVTAPVGPFPPQLLLPTGFAVGSAVRQRQGIEIDYVAGYGTDPSSVPAGLCQALLTLVAYWFEHRDSVVIAGSGSVVPTGFDLLVAPFRRVRL